MTSMWLKLTVFLLMAHLGCGRNPRRNARGRPRYDDQALASEGGRTRHNHGYNGRKLEPTFDETQSSKNITLIRGQMAHFHCVINNVGNRSVTWLRHTFPIPQVYGLNNVTNVADPRVTAFHTPDTEEYVLRITHTRVQDSGFYECQVAGVDNRPSLFRLIYLDVVEPITKILGGPDIYVDRGSTLNVTCAVAAGTKEPDYIYWSKNDKIVLFDGTETSKQPFLLKDSRGRSISRLVIDDIDHSHAGVYTCQPEASEAQSVTVHVLNGTVLAVAADSDEPGTSPQQQTQGGSSQASASKTQERYDSDNSQLSSVAASRSRCIQAAYFLPFVMATMGLLARARNEHV